MERYKTKAQMMWEVSKEQEEVFRKGLLSREHNEIELDELFKLIRGAEYRRGKEDGIKECKDEHKNVTEKRK